MSRLQITLLGPFGAFLDERPLTTWKSHKVRALLAFLAAQPHRPHPRSLLADLLWPNRTERDALRLLSYALAALRRTLHERHAPSPFLRIDRDTLQLPRQDGLWVDALELADAAPADRAPPPDALRQALDLYRGPFLEGFLCDSAPWEEWLATERERYARLACAALRRLGEHHVAGGAWEEAAACARRELEMEPWDEGAHRLLMRALALGGQRGAALAHYDACRRTLAEGLGVDPDPETQALFGELLDGTLRAAEQEEEYPPAVAVPERTQEAQAPAFVGREKEVEELRGLLTRALRGEGRLHMVVGEPGAGKTYLLQHLARGALDTHPDLVVGLGQCNAYVGIGDAFAPFGQLLRGLTGEASDQWPEAVLTHQHRERLRRLLPRLGEALVGVGTQLLGTLISAEGLLRRARAAVPEERGLLADLEREAARGRERPGDPGVAPGQLFQQFVGVIRAVSLRAPLLLVIDDLQWADASSLSLLFHLSRSLAGSRVLVLGAYRPGDVALGRGGKRHPLEALVNELRQAQGEVLTDLDRSDGREFVEDLLEAEGEGVPPGLAEQLYAQAAGHALFTVELLRGLRERGMLERAAEGLTQIWEELPARAQGVIAERLGRLPDGLRRALEVASVQGENLTAEVVARVLGVSEQEAVRTLGTALGGAVPLLLSQGVSRVGGQRLSRYRFRHYLYQSHLYRNLDAGQRAYLHEDVARALEALYGERAAELAAELARHYEEAGAGLQAARYLAMGAERAYWLMALDECVALCQRGLALLDGLPLSPARVDTELALLIWTAEAGMTGYGWNAPEMDWALERAESLARENSRTHMLCLALFNSILREGWRDPEPARLRAEELLRLAPSSDDPLDVVRAYEARAWERRYRGAMPEARQAYARAVALLRQMIADGVQTERARRRMAWTLVSFAALVLWPMGYADQARELADEGERIVRDLGLPLTFYNVGYWRALLAAQCGDLARAKRLADATLASSGNPEDPRQRFVWLRLIGCWPLVVEGLEADSGKVSSLLEETRRYWEDDPKSYAWTVQLLTDCYRRLGHLTEAIDLASGEVSREAGLPGVSELLVLRGEALLERDEDEARAEADFRFALEMSRSQDCKSLELRAATSLARLWRSQGRREEALALLAPVYEWFTEGLDTVNLREARALLDELGYAGGASVPAG